MFWQKQARQRRLIIITILTSLNQIDKTTNNKEKTSYLEGYKHAPEKKLT